ncbi:PREDICTED: uncharacterized protein LOC108374742, partial [Rhagoletis zephyria]|uniref:uncharacterized protein LOC108374742 n=1 Tax=Rhagoletis zephyria TaxID=28612 RepID=UPI0008119E13
MSPHCDESTYTRYTPEKLAGYSVVSLLVFVLTLFATTVSTCGPLVNSNSGLSTKANTEHVWKEISSKLNCYGPPTRTSVEWQRVWIHFKAKLKKKMPHNRRNISITGGGPSDEISLSALKQAAADFMQMAISVDPPGPTFGAILPQQPQDTENIAYIEEINTILEVETEQPQQETVTPLVAVQLPRRKRAQDIRLDLLQQQTGTQGEVVNKLDKIERKLSRRNDLLKDIRD